MKYDTLVTILDTIRAEAPTKYSAKYQPNGTEIEKINNARSRAFIHLYLKVAFGVLDFEEREHFVTDGTGDGGVDAYYIDDTAKTICFIQAKFRTTVNNFEEKPITLEEILKIDIARIMEGETCDETGQPYGGKIKQLQREISSLPDVARFKYSVVLLANVKDVSATKLKQVTGGFPVSVFDFERTYSELVFPVISGTYFTAHDISIPIDLSNKNAGSKISYTVATKISECEITVLFVPTVEIARIMSKYKNSILKYNPRSYLDLQGQQVNDAIRNTILNTQTNEFALYNNGITILSDETNINERIGQKNKAQLRIKNPQIINGGQTSYTLSRIYEEHRDNDPERVFQEKEVLLKIITVMGDAKHGDKLQLIDEISNATNRQTPVLNADRFANDATHQAIQRLVFDRYGFLYERKRGEFSDGLLNRYVDSSLILERNGFLRVYYAANGQLNKAIQKRLFQKNNLADIDLRNIDAFDKWFIGTQVFHYLLARSHNSKHTERTLLVKVFIYVEMYGDERRTIDANGLSGQIGALENEFAAFMAAQQIPGSRFMRTVTDARTGVARVTFAEAKYLRSGRLESDLLSYFRPKGGQLLSV
jgi:hypothetical protein